MIKNSKENFSFRSLNILFISYNLFIILFIFTNTLISFYLHEEDIGILINLIVVFIWIIIGTPFTIFYYINYVKETEGN